MRRVGILILWLPLLIVAGLIPVMWLLIRDLSSAFNEAMENKP